MSDGLWFTKDANGYTGWFGIERSNGELRTGATSGFFTATIVNPADSATSVPTVTESSAKPGLYKFTVPSAFLLANGIGVYGVVVEVAVTSNPKVTGTLSAMLSVSTKDFEDLVGADANAVAEAIWEYVPASVIAGSFGQFILQLHEAKILASGLVIAGTTSSSIKTDISEIDTYYDGYSIQVIDDTNPTSGIDVAIRKIDGYLNVDGEFIVADVLPFTPPIGSRVVILGNHDERSGTA